MSALVWEKVKNKFGDYDYVSGRFRIERITGDSYYKWHLSGRGRDSIGSGCCTTLSSGKAWAQRILDAEVQK